MENPFDVLGLPHRFDLDPAEIESRYRDLQRAVHPDRHAREAPAERRAALGADKLLAVEQKVVLTRDATIAREVARRTLAIYMNLPNYSNNWRRLGFTDADLADGGSDRFLDAMVVWGDEAAIAARVAAHQAAGAAHVCVELPPTAPDRATIPLDGWRRLAPALL